jgi:hypothetical protein
MPDQDQTLHAAGVFEAKVDHRTSLVSRVEKEQLIIL